MYKLEFKLAEKKSAALAPYELGAQEGVVSSLVMMLAGVLTVVIAPLIGRCFW